jgi:hypothetical protein
MASEVTYVTRAAGIANTPEMSVMIFYAMNQISALGRLTGTPYYP